MFCISIEYVYKFNADERCWDCGRVYKWCCSVKWMIKDKVLYFIVVLNLISRDGVAKTLSAALRWRCVRFKVFVSLLLDQLVSVSPRLVGPYNGGGGFQVLWSNGMRYVCSFVLL